MPTGYMDNFIVYNCVYTWISILPENYKTLLINKIPARRYFIDC